MPWIRVIDEDEAEGELQQIYQEIAGARGKVANIMKIHSLLPQTMKRHLELYLSILFGRTGLTRPQREMIAVVVSAQNRCAYCLNHHGQALNAYWKDDEKLANFQRDFRSIALGQAERAMLDYSAKLTRDPAGVGERDIQALHEAGFSDEQILSINLIASYFNFVNRVAEGLNVEFSEEEMRGYKY
ncbi:MAG TPA: peroxidase [Candidatus Fraserbacteria bacterium]|nr:peroxidase [Candidatus Fraserbacteria bacterium]